MKFPFFDHLYLNDADRLQMVRQRIGDGEIVAYARFHLTPYGLTVSRFEQFIKRNARPIQDAA